jgi:hypothetical protein
MKTSTKKFIKWLVIGDILVLVFLIVLGFIFISPNCVLDCSTRFEMLGRGAGQFIISSNIAAFLIFYGIRIRICSKNSK